MRALNAWLLGLLAWLIVAYRRWISGRGPLRDVRCSFAAEESCSAFGLRATREAPTARAALGRIMRRLGRCRDACLLGDGTTVSWAPLHDRAPSEIVAEMRCDGEQAPAIARMLETRRVVAIWRADRVAMRELAGAAIRKPVIYSHPGTARRSRRRIAGFVLLACVAAGAIWFRPVLGTAMLVTALVAGGLAVRTLVSRMRRFAHHAAISRSRTAGAHSRS